MLDSAIVLLSALGGLVSFVFWVTGCYPWMRWGYTGVAAIWSKRHEIDDIVRRDIIGVLDR